MAAGPFRSPASVIRRVFDAIVFCLLPTFLHRHPLSRKTQPSSAGGGGGEHDSAPPTAPTAWLDGLRGVCALVVYVYHLLYMSYPRMKAGYLATAEDTAVPQYVFVRDLMAGRSCVSVFFVISGYVLSVRPLALARHGRLEQALDGLARSAFRRPFRLYIPIAAATFPAALATRFPATYFRHSMNFTVPEMEPSLWGQIRHWASHMVRMMDPAQVPFGRTAMYKPPYNLFLWTIPTELKGSLYVFACLLALLRVRPAVRLAAMAVMICHTIQSGDYDMALFGSGMALAELSLMMEQVRCPPGRAALCRARLLLSLALLPPALYLVGYPDEGDEKSSQWSWLASRTPDMYNKGVFIRQFFWNATGALLFVAALVLWPVLGRKQLCGGSSSCSGSSSPPLLLPLSLPLSPPLSTSSSPEPKTTSIQVEDPESALPAGLSSLSSSSPILHRPFNTRFAQYLGRISYALYLVQAPVIQMISMRYIAAGSDAYNGRAVLGLELRGRGEEEAADALMAEAKKAYTVNFAVCAVVSTAVLFWASDLFWRYVDQHAATVGRRVGAWACASRRP